MLCQSALVWSYISVIREVLSPSSNVHITDLDNFLSALVSIRAKALLLLDALAALAGVSYGQQMYS